MAKKRWTTEHAKLARNYAELHAMYDQEVGRYDEAERKLTKLDASLEHLEAEITAVNTSLNAERRLRQLLEAQLEHFRSVVALAALIVQKPIESPPPRTPEDR